MVIEGVTVAAAVNGVDTLGMTGDLTNEDGNIVDK